MRLLTERDRAMLHVANVHGDLTRELDLVPGLQPSLPPASMRCATAELLGELLGHAPESAKIAWAVVYIWAGILLAGLLASGSIGLAADFAS